MGGHWNYRQIYLGKEFDEPIYGICEVYYDENGKPNGRTEPVTVIGEHPGVVLMMMKQALKKPILDQNLKEMLPEKEDK